jgi:cytosine/adenosine deaminase-related metal-dependent hydrolase
MKKAAFVLGYAGSILALVFSMLMILTVPLNLANDILDDMTEKLSSEGVLPIVDLGEVALFPGLVNAHCHLDYTCLRDRIQPPKDSFADWIKAINAAKTTLTPHDYRYSINAGFVEAKRFGTRGLANLTAFPALARQTDEIVSTTWFAELIDVRTSLDAGEMVKGAIDALGEGVKIGLAPHAPFTASRNLYLECGVAAQSSSILLTTHLAESKDEMAMFRDARGPLYDFLAEIGRDMSDCGGTTPLMRFLQVADIKQPWLLAHLNELTEADLTLLAQFRDRFAVVHCPRSHHYFGHAAFPFSKLRALGLNVCLGTDSLASNQDLSLFAEMRQFQKEFPDVDAEELVSMATSRGASALQRTRFLGRIAVGCSSDLIAIPFTGSREAIFEAIIAFEGEPLANFTADASKD